MEKAPQHPDGRALDDTLKRATTTLGAQGVLHRLVAPLTRTLGGLWHEGKITAAHEHFAGARWLPGLRRFIWATAGCKPSLTNAHESEVVSGKTKASGPIELDLDGSHAHLARIHWSTHGVVR